MTKCIKFQVSNLTKFKNNKEILKINLEKSKGQQLGIKLGHKK
jgi:hypothetical protein